MSRFAPRRPSAALIVSVIALIAALCGTSYAAFSLPKNSVGTKQLKNGAATTKKLEKAALLVRFQPFPGHARQAAEQRGHQQAEQQRDLRPTPARTG